MISQDGFTLLARSFETFFNQHFSKLSIPDNPIEEAVFHKSLDEKQPHDAMLILQKEKIVFFDYEYMLKNFPIYKSGNLNSIDLLQEFMDSKDAFELVKLFKALINDMEYFKSLKLDKTAEFEFRFTNVGRLTRFSQISSKLKDMLITLRGTVIHRWDEVRSMPNARKWECVECGTEKIEFIKRGEKKRKYKKKCMAIIGEGEKQFPCPSRTYNFIEDCNYEDLFRVRIEALPEDTPDKMQLPSFYIEFTNNICHEKFINEVINGEAFEFIGIVMLQESETKTNEVIFTPYLKLMSYRPIQKREKAIMVTEKEREQIIEFLKKEDSIDKLKNKFATRVIGYKREKKFYLIMKALQECYNLRSKSKKAKDFLCHLLLVGDWSCVAGDTRVVLGNGKFMKIQDMGKEHLQTIDVPVFMNRNNSKDKYYGKATQFHLYKSVPTLLITTETGKSIQCTYNHPLKTKRVWVNAEELKIGDKIQVIKKIPCNFKKYIKLKTEKVKQKSFNLSKEEYELDEDIALFAGYLQGDGWFRTGKKEKYEIGFVVSEDEYDAQKVLSLIIKNKFNYDVKENIIKGNKNLLRKIPIIGTKKLSYNYIYSKEIVSLFEFIRRKDCVPDQIFCSKNSVIANYIKGLFDADGTVINYYDKKRKDSKPKIIFSQKLERKKLIQDLQLLLLRFGIRAVIQDNMIKDQATITICKSKDILKFEKHIGFLCKKKKDRLNKIKRIAEKINKKNNRKESFYEKIKSIEKAGKTNVYDIHVPTYNRFIGNGIVCHNTGKSEFGEACLDLSYKRNYITGSSTTGVGLTGRTDRDEYTGRYVIQAGALARASGDILIVEEFDKQENKAEFGVINEAMSKFEYTVTKAGESRTFRCNTSLIVIANPIHKKFDLGTSFYKQIDITGDLLSRFTVISCIVDDGDINKQLKINEIMIKRNKRELYEKDRKNAEFIRKCIKVASEIEPELTQDVLDYIDSWTKETYAVRTQAYGEDKEFWENLGTSRNRHALIKIIKGVALLHYHKKPTYDDMEEARKLFVEFQKDIIQNPEFLNLEHLTLGRSIEEVKEDYAEKLSQREWNIKVEEKKDTKKGKVDLLLSYIGKFDELAYEDLEAYAIANLNYEKRELSGIIQALFVSGDIYEPRKGFLRMI